MASSSTNAGHEVTAFVNYFLLVIQKDVFRTVTAFLYMCWTPRITNTTQNHQQTTQMAAHELLVKDTTQTNLPS